MDNKRDMEIYTSERIKLLCKRKGIKMTDLAERCGWSGPNLANKLRRNNLTESDLQLIAEALGCKLVIDFVADNE